LSFPIRKYDIAKQSKLKTTGFQRGLITRYKSSAHFSLRPVTQKAGRKITIRQADVNISNWAEESRPGQIYRPTKVKDDGYQQRAKGQLEKGLSSQQWLLIIQRSSRQMRALWSSRGRTN
jgi:hypothetical protein